MGASPVFATDTPWVCLIRHGVLRHSPIDLARGAISIIANVTLWAGGGAAEHLGEPEGRFAGATAAVYAAILGLVFALLLLG